VPDDCIPDQRIDRAATQVLNAPRAQEAPFAPTQTALADPGGLESAIGVGDVDVALGGCGGYSSAPTP